MRYKCILMDIDDTIFDFMPGNRNAIAMLMEELGLSSPLFPHLHLARSSQQEVVSGVCRIGDWEKPGNFSPSGLWTAFSSSSCVSSMAPAPLSSQYLPGSLLLWFQAHQMALLLLLGTTCVSLQPQGTEDFLLVSRLPHRSSPVCLPRSSFICVICSLFYLFCSKTLYALCFPDCP